MKFHWDLKRIRVSEIDTTDHTWHLGLLTDAAPMVDSVRAVGLINPPILRQRQDLKYQIACGFRRVAACKALGWEDINSRVLAGDLQDMDIFELVIHDNRSHRPLHIVEQAQGIRKLSSYVPIHRRLALLSSLLEFPQNEAVFHKLQALSGLPETIRIGLVEETISFEAAALLAQFSQKDALSCFDILKPLKLSQNKQTEIITWVQEIAVRENIEPGDVVRSEPIQRILEQPDLNREQKGSRLRGYLKKRRFPALAQAEENFSAEAKALKLNGHIHITPPANFEGGAYTLRMTFRTLADFEQRVKTLEAMSKNPALERLLKPFD